MSFTVPQYFIDIGPLLLVLVTLVYIGFAGFGYIEGRREREISRKSLQLLENDLQLQRKPSIVDTIAFSIDPIIDILEEDRQKLETITGSNRKYPVLDDIEFLDGDLLTQVPERDINLQYEMGAYNAVRKAYMAKREHLKELLTKKLPDGLEDENLDAVLRAAGSSLEDRSGPEDAFMEKVRDRSHNLAEITLCGDRTQSGKGWIDNNLDSLRLALFDFREEGELSEDFEELDELRQDVIEESKRIGTDLKTAKEELMNEYDITDTDVWTRREDFES